MLVMVSTDPSGSVQDDIKTGHRIMGRKEKREEDSNQQKPVRYNGGKVYSRPRSRAIAVVSRCTVFGPPTLFDRGRICGRKGTS